MILYVFYYCREGGVFLAHPTGLPFDAHPLKCIDLVKLSFFYHFHNLSSMKIVFDVLPELLLQPFTLEQRYLRC